MTELSCAVTRDLLPLYTEGLVSAETAAAIDGHLAFCGECAKLRASCITDLNLPGKTSAKTDRRIVRRIRLNYLWFLFWPMLYAASIQFGFQDSVTRFFILALVVILGLSNSQIADGNFDPERRKEYYRMDEERLRKGKRTVIGQLFIWALPILLPLLFQLVPWMIDYAASPHP